MFVLQIIWKSSGNFGQTDRWYVLQKSITDPEYRYVLITPRLHRSTGGPKCSVHPQFWHSRMRTHISLHSKCF